jgi:hypothetical protein
MERQVEMMEEESASGSGSGSGTGSYAEAAATPPVRPHYILEAEYTKKPINTATYIELRSYLKKVLMATHVMAIQFGLEQKSSINFTPLPFESKI